MEVHSGNGDIVRKTYEYPYGHMDILYGSMQVMSCLCIAECESAREFRSAQYKNKTQATFPKGERAQE